MSRLNTIIEYMHHRSELQPDMLSQRFINIDAEETERYTFGSFAERTRELAAFLSREAGLRAGERVLLVYPPGLEFNVAFFACAWLGVVAVPAAAPLPSAPVAGLLKLSYMARDCQADVVLTTSEVHQTIHFLLAHLEDVSPQHADFELPPLRWVTTDDTRGFGGAPVAEAPRPLLFLQYTSGSTSDPKGVIVSHSNIIHNVHAIAYDHLNLEEHAVSGVSWLPQYHDMGLIGGCLTPIIMGGSVDLLSPLDFLQRPSLWWRQMSALRGSHTAGPNFAYEYCLRQDKLPEEELRGIDLGCVINAMSGAEPVRSSTMNRFFERFAPYGLRREAISASYGLAENTLAVTMRGLRVLTLNKQALQGGTVRLENTLPRNNNQTQLMSCGRPASGVVVRIAEPSTGRALSEGVIGEVWIDGTSKAGGYWERPELSEQTFQARILGESERTYLRTGDLGFLLEGELYICGRLKDMIILRGVNYYPQDIEAVVEAASVQVRPGGVTAFSVEDAEEGEALVIVAEVGGDELPDPMLITRALRTRYYVEPRTLVFVNARSVAKTTSGKVSRSQTRQLWLAGELPVRAVHDKLSLKAPDAAPALAMHFPYLVELYGLRGDETHTFVDVGIDSLVFARLVSDIKELLAGQGAAGLTQAVDTRLLQRVRIVDFVDFVTRLGTEREQSLEELRETLAEVQAEYDTYEASRMREDIEFVLPSLTGTRPSGPPRNLLLTGPTGVLGPFLVREMLDQTTATLELLVRAAAPEHGMARVIAALHKAKIWTPALETKLRARTRIVCGDLASPRLGLDEATWQRLAQETDAILHNGALVNYVLNYDSMRAANVEGTRELLRLAATATPKVFHLISTTFVYGWTPHLVVGEADRNPGMENLDFGYSQTKWVAEQLAFSAARQGLDVRVYRPSLIGPTRAGAGSRDDILVRSVAFVLRYGVAARAENQLSVLSADLVAHHIVAIARLPEVSSDTFNITADDVYTAEDVLRKVCELYGYSFTYHDVETFVAECRRLSTPRDPIYPLINFAERSYSKALSMKDKRYDNAQYRKARVQAQCRLEHPPLDETVRDVIEFMRAEGLIIPR